MSIQLPLNSINCNGKLLELNKPLIAGILNITPDSFYDKSRTFLEEEIIKRIHELLDQGADLIDIGGYSSRPGADDVPQEEEIRRIKLGIELIKSIQPSMPISVDTFRSKVASIAIEMFGADIINDISAGELDRNMFKTVAKLKVPYIMMHMKGTPKTMQFQTHYDNYISEILNYFASKIEKLRNLGLNDIILDPGFGFGKDLNQNYTLLSHLDLLLEFKLPLLIGISRKSMIYKLLNSSPEKALNGTTALHMYALCKGANILRVHDVKSAKEVVNLYNKLQIS